MPDSYRWIVVIALLVIIAAATVTSAVTNVLNRRDHLELIGQVGP